MTKRRTIRWSLILAILAAFAVWLEPTRVVWGWLRGAAFYQGRPTSWWAEQLRPWKIADGLAGNFVRLFNEDSKRIRALRGSQDNLEDSKIEEGLFAVQLFAQPSSFRAWIAKWISLSDPTWPCVLDGDTAAKRVLTELQSNDDPHVRHLARIGVQRFETPKQGPVVVLKLRYRVPPSISDIEQAIQDALRP